MAKSADDAARLLTFPISITDLAGVIGEYFEDCCARDPEEDDSTYREDFSEACIYIIIICSKRSVIDFLGNE